MSGKEPYPDRRGYLPGYDSRRLKAFLALAEMSRKELAEAAGLSRPALSEYLNESKRITPEVRRKLTAGLRAAFRPENLF